MVPIRYVICVLCTLVGLVTFLTRSNINIAIVSMIEPDRNASAGNDHLCPGLRTDSSESGNQTTPLTGEVFEWSAEVQGTLLGCFFWSYCTFQAPSGYINGRYGGRLPVSLSLLVSAIITALGPTFAHISVYLLIASRIVMGVFQAAIFPGVFVIAIGWVPPQERAMAMAMNEIGSSIGTIFLFFTSGFLVQRFTWTSLFYMPAIASLMAFVVFFFFVRNSPEEHPFISEKEVAYIRGLDDKSSGDIEMESSSNSEQQPADDVSIESYESEKDLVQEYSIPWRKMLTNKAVISLCLFKFSRTMVFHFINSKIPYYLKTVLNEDLVSIGITYAIFTGILLAMVLISAKISEIIIEKGWLSRTNTRRFFSLFAGTGSAVSFMMIAAFRCNATAVKVFFYFIAIGQGCGMAADVVMPPEMTTHFSAILYALGNMSQVIPGFVSPMFAGFVLGRYGEEWIAWDIIINTIGVFGIVCNIIFLIFIRAEKQDFDYVKEPPPRDHRTMSIVSALSGHLPY